MTVIKLKAQTWELLMYNTNHVHMKPKSVIKSSSYDLCDYLMNSLLDVFEANQYRSFKLMIKCIESGAIVRDY